MGLYDGLGLPDPARTRRSKPRQYRDNTVRDKLSTLDGIRAAAYDTSLSDRQFRCRVDDYFAALDAGDPLL